MPRDMYSLSEAHRHVPLTAHVPPLPARYAAASSAGILPAAATRHQHIRVGPPKGAASGRPLITRFRLSPKPLSHVYARQLLAAPLMPNPRATPTAQKSGTAGRQPLNERSLPASSPHAAHARSSRPAHSVSTSTLNPPRAHTYTWTAPAASPIYRLMTKDVRYLNL